VLIHKLRRFGVGQPLIAWLESYLTNRVQIVKIGNFLSRKISVPSGVLQGFHLGPLLFTVFINDICECFTCAFFLLFADDLKMSLVIRTPEDYDKLQYDLSNLQEWCLRNGMELNPTKCKAMTFSHSRTQINFQYRISHFPLEKISLVKDLGVTLESSLQFSQHLSNAVGKAFQMLGFIRRTTQDFNGIAALKTLYCALVRPNMEYASCVWSPHYATHVHALSLVEHKFLKQVAYKLHILDNYTDSEVLTLLNMSPIISRHKKRDLQTFYNILHGRVIALELLQKINICIPSRSTRSIDSFHYPSHRTNFGSNSFISRCSRLANRHTDIDFFSPYVRFLNQLDNVIM